MTKTEQTGDKFRDECGVFGIFGHPEAANLTYLGLYALQHRGQESAGIAASDGTQVRISKSMGYVADAFSEKTLEKLPGRLAIGHVRYSTSGDSSVDNAQPILIDCAHGQIAIGHNGNIINATELKDELVRHGSIFQTTSDTEVILHLYARSRAASIDDALVESMSHVQGAFSLVMCTKDRLIAVRDPHGFRPLALGRLGEAVIVCSETCALDLIGATYIRDVEPGEVVIVSASGVRSFKPFAPAPPRNAFSSTCISPGRTATCSARASTRSARISAACWRASSLRKRTWWCRCPTRASARRSALPKNPACPCASA